MFEKYVHIDCIPWGYPNSNTLVTKVTKTTKPVLFETPESINPVLKSKPDAPKHNCSKAYTVTDPTTNHPNRMQPPLIAIEISLNPSISFAGHCQTPGYWNIYSFIYCTNAMTNISILHFVQNVAWFTVIVARLINDSRYKITMRNYFDRRFTKSPNIRSV